jgi:NAD(P)-dependent dehydrogenase (short-subunit alcohol dehydrogenase family)
MKDGLFDLSDKVLVVTGGAGLIGQALVRGLSSAGGLVYIAENDVTRSEALAKELNAEDLRVKFQQMDVTTERSVSEGINAILKHENGIDVWINNAYQRTSDWGLKYDDIPQGSWRQNVDWQLNSHCFCCQKIYPVMRNQGKGSIINIASTYGVVGPDFSIYEGTGMTMPAAYSAIKGGIINFTRYLAAYCGEHGIRANCISPGGVFDSQPDSFVQKYCRRTPLKRMASPSDFVGAAVFLASDASSYVTGHNLLVDGGWSAI